MTSSDASVSRSTLRKDFLDTLMILRDKNMTLEMYETGLTSLNATYKSSDGQFNHLIVENLETAIGIVPKAIVRTSDIISMNFKLV